MQSRIIVSNIYRTAEEIDLWCDAHNCERPAFLSDSQDLAGLQENFSGNSRMLDGITAALVVTGDADYLHVWVTTSSRPYDVNAFFRKVRLYIYSAKPRQSPQWKLTTDFNVNTATAKSVGLELAEEWTYTRFQGEQRSPITGTRRQLFALAAQLRYEWISANGYNMIVVSRTAGRVRYDVLPHFGMRGYTLATLERI